MLSSMVCFSVLFPYVQTLCNIPPCPEALGSKTQISYHLINVIINGIDVAWEDTIVYCSLIQKISVAADSKNNPTRQGQWRSTRNKLFCIGPEARSILGFLRNVNSVEYVLDKLRKNIWKRQKRTIGSPLHTRNRLTINWGKVCWNADESNIQE
jgi:hypothetical protein